LNKTGKLGAMSKTIISMKYKSDLLLVNAKNGTTSIEFTTGNINILLLMLKIKLKLWKSSFSINSHYGDSNEKHSS